MRRITGIMAGVFLILGAAVLLYNPLLSRITRLNMDKEISIFEQATEKSGQVHFSEGKTESANAYQNLMEEMQDYNKKLYESGQSGLTDAWSCEQAAFDFTEYGLPTEIMGILHIPAMEEELPVYLGATEENMEKGVAVLGQTSMPVGGVNTNCVIAGHRGYGGVAFFRDIEALQTGDRVYLTTYWGKRTYQVESTAVILPDNIDAVLIQESRELLTLVTCHPYTEGTHRYVVYCTAAENGTSEDVPIGGEQPVIKAEADAAYSADWEKMERSSSQNRIQLERWLPLLAIPLAILAAVILIRSPKNKDTDRNRSKDANEKNTT